MALKDNFGHPRGMMGRFVLSGMNMGHTPMAKWGITQIDIPRKADIVDIGCGGGFNVKRLLSNIAEGHVYGVDVSAVSVEKTRAVNKKALGTRCEVYQADAQKLPFDDGVLDLATAFETVYFWKNIGGCFREVRRVLKPGGQFAVINDSGDTNKHWEDVIPGMTVYSPEDIEALMKESGFADIRITAKKNMYCVVGSA
ncbi:MAG: class I SAM-dependent methyltransferase [Clostridia bacterium]|nr:class I SAM-dependent methyltransferase [Clostridia bacterium]